MENEGEILLKMRRSEHDAKPMSFYYGLCKRLLNTCATTRLCFPRNSLKNLPACSMVAAEISHHLGVIRLVAALLTDLLESTFVLASLLTIQSRSLGHGLKDCRDLLGF